MTPKHLSDCFSPLPEFVPLEISDYIDNPKGVSDLLLWTQRTKQE